MQHITPDLFADLEQPDEVCISRDGRFIAYSARPRFARSGEHVTSSIWLAETSKHLSARQLTRGLFNDSAPCFSPDTKHLAFLSDREQPGKASAIYLLSLNGGEAFRLTPDADEKNISSYKWSPDGTFIAYLKAQEDSEERKKQIKDKDDVDVWGEHFDSEKIHVIEISTRETTILMTGEGHIAQLDWRKNGEDLVFSVTPTPDFDTVVFRESTIMTTGLNSRKTTRICVTPWYPRDVLWAEDEIMLIKALQDPELTSAQALFRVAPTSDSKPEHVAHGISDCASQLKNCWGTVIIHNTKGMVDRLSIAKTSESLWEGMQGITSWDAVIENDYRKVALVKGTSGTPAEIFSVINGNICQLSDHGKTLAKLDIGFSQIIEDQNEDGTPMDGYYCVPRSMKSDFEAKQPLPTLVIVHGGPYSRSADGFFVDLFAPAWFMAQGYLVLVANYRGGMGHGNDYAMAVKGNAAASYVDVVWLVQRGVRAGNIDKNRTAIFGWSQGGFLSYTAVTRSADFHFAAAIPGAGVTDWMTMAMTSDVPTFEAVLGGKLPWDAEISFIEDRKSSPIYHMQNVRTPVLILHGEEDVRVPVSQAKSFHRAMKARGVECEMAIYPREGHGATLSFERLHYVDMMKRMQRFLAKHMG